MKPILFACLMTAGIAVGASAASIDTRLSTHEAYVGSPVTLQITISDATDYEQPMAPAIDGCDVRSAGVPAQSSQITIINGRRRESRSVTMQYLVTPRREGTFVIPAMTFKVDGKPVTTQPERFVAAKSETGDLMFVEIEGGKDKVFVGQPLDLKLKIWLRPFRDPSSGITLSEGDMWNMISESTAWGGFTTRMKELRDNNQRPGGHEVLRDSGNGSERAYYLYEINATVYPKRAGKIDASDVQIVVDYPTSIGKSRSPLSQMFDDDVFGGHSMMSQMMNDDFFGSAFGNRLAVRSSRPIVGEVKVDATEVLPVPTQGRPADYRGAVGRYTIVTQATPTTVDAGDPITLNLGIMGTGPMELVQAPPMHEQADLVADFKIADESLAGFVKDDTKVFSTSIRPRREGITQIPAIRFSYFDPDTETFHTVTSDPIAITVNKSETLAMDAIIGSSRTKPADSAGPSAAGDAPNFTNHSDASLLVSHAPRTAWNWLALCLAVPPMAWFVLAIGTYRQWIASRLPSLRSAKSRCLSSIERADNAPAIQAALTTYLLRVLPASRNRLASQSSNQSHSTAAMDTEAVGRLRKAGWYELAGDVESFLNVEHESTNSGTHQRDALDSIRQSATDLVHGIVDALAKKQKTKVYVPTSPRVHRSSLSKAVALLLSLAVAGAANTSSASGIPSNPMTLDLSPAQQSSVLAEANAAYTQAIEKSSEDSADAKELFATAISKYQLLVDSGIQNADLFVNLGNASAKSGKLGSAIANYERALQLDPSHAQASANLAYVDKSIGHVSTTNSPAASASLALPTSMRPVTTWTLAIASVVFWSLLILRLLQPSFPVWKCAAVPFVLMLVCGAVLGISPVQTHPPHNAVIVADRVVLHASDGESFDTVATIDEAQGQRVTRLTARGDWDQIKTGDGQTGWIHHKDLEVVTF